MNVLAPGAVLALAVAAGQASVGAATPCPAQDLAKLSIDQVQRLLSAWNLDHAVGTEFAAQKVDGFKLNAIAQPGAVDPSEYPNAQPFDWIALRAHILECKDAPSVEPVAVRRNLQSSTASSVGLHIKKDQGGLILGADGDVQVRRSGDNSLLLNASYVTAGMDLEVGGDLYVDGHLHLSTGNISAANVDSLVSSVASLWAVVDSLSDAVSTNSDDISGTADDVDAIWDLVSTLNATVADNAECCEANSDAIDDLIDAVALLEVTVDPYGDRIVYESDFENDWSGWTFDGADIQTTDCLNHTALGGNLGSGDSVSLYLEGLPLHSSLTVDFTFLAIDSWDSEVATLELDGEVVWTKAFKHSSSSYGNVCHNGWSDNKVTASVEIDHFEQALALQLYTSLDSSASDETWAISDVVISTRLSSDYTPVYTSDFDENGAAGWTFFGGADAQTSTCGDHLILGGYGVLAKESSVVKNLNDLPDHTQLVISFEFFKIDSWDSEHGKLYVDDVLVWSKAMGGYTGSANICGGSSRTDAIVPITVKVAHDESIAKLRFTSTLNQGATDESWGIKSLAVYADSPDEVVQYQTNFESWGSWIFDGADPEITTCGDYNVLGGYDVLGVDTSVLLYLHDLTPHTSLTIEFDFAKIDSWDTESAFVYVDDNLEWTQVMRASDGEPVCGSSNSNWDEDFVPVSMTFDHWGQDVKILVTTDLSSSATDESWGLANFKITSSMDDCTALVYSSDLLTNLLDGWSFDGASPTNITMCGKEALIGGPNLFGKGASATITIDLGSEGNGVLVAFTFIKVDSWDGESAQLYADDVLVWSEAMSGSSGSQLCGSSSTNWHEEKVIREVDLGWVTTDSVTLTFTSTLNQAASDESWGLGDLDVFTYDVCDDVVYQSDFASDGDDGWIIIGSDGGTTTCSGMTFLGGYNVFDYSDLAQKLVSLPLHTSLQVDFTFVKIDSWDSEKAYMYIDHSKEWEKTMSGSSGEQLCGRTNTNWNEDLIEETIVVDHFSPHAWLQWKSGLSSGGTDESWGIANVKVTTFMDTDTYTPVYQSRFQFKQIDGWDIDGLDSSASGYFTECADIVMMGGYKTFAKDAEATKLITHLPPHDSVLIAWTWAKIDSWDGEYFYVYADGTAIYSQKGSASTGDNLCGRSNTNWDESFFSNYKEIDHTSDELELMFTTSINQAGSDESWGLVGVDVYVS